mmetsp:Transcript_26994/g.48988  ORF Transcript_26994/g.48988 Transcript_26994/m.48988 type:complete len:201 (-) Transcript_26994:1533-2135(-)
MLRDACTRLVVTGPAGVMCGNTVLDQPTTHRPKLLFRATFRPCFQGFGRIAIHQRRLAQRHARDGTQADRILDPAATDTTGHSANRIALQVRITTDLPLAPRIAPGHGLLHNRAWAQVRPQRRECCRGGRHVGIDHSHVQRRIPPNRSQRRLRTSHRHASHQHRGKRQTPHRFAPRPKSGASVSCPASIIPRRIARVRVK